MKISVVSAKGVGQTLLSAFDNALKKTGVYNFNLLRLSSVIPPNTIVEIVKKPTVKGEWGDKLYIVQAEIRSETPGKALAAGIGWYQFNPDGRGVFVEHETLADTPEEAHQIVEDLIYKSLEDLCIGRNEVFKTKKVQSQIVSHKVSKEPVCALVLAIYQSESWNSGE